MPARKLKKVKPLINMDGLLPTLKVCTDQLSMAVLLESFFLLLIAHIISMLQNQRLVHPKRVRRFGVNI